MRAAVIIALLLLSCSAAFAEEDRTVTCDKDTLFSCLVELPCDTYHRNPQGDVVLMGIKLKFAKTPQPREFNQAELESAVESRCGKIK